MKETKLFGVQKYRARLLGSEEWVEGYPVIVKGIDCTNTSKPKDVATVYMFTDSVGTELTEIVGKPIYYLIPNQVEVDFTTLCPITEEDKILN